MIKQLTAAEFESRLIALEALQEQNRFAEATTDQKYVNAIRSYLLNYLYGDLEQGDKDTTEQYIQDTLLKIEDIQLRDTVRVLVYV